MIDFFKRIFGIQSPASGATAKERLRLVLLSDHLSLAPDVVEALKRDLLEVISRYVEIDENHADVTFEHRDREIAMLASVPIRSVLSRPLPPPSRAPQPSPSNGSAVVAVAPQPVALAEPAVAAVEPVLAAEPAALEEPVLAEESARAAEPAVAVTEEPAAPQAPVPVAEPAVAEAPPLSLVPEERAESGAPEPPGEFATVEGAAQKPSSNSTRRRRRRRKAAAAAAAGQPLQISAAHF
jgi:cell division topological specificity factor